jgi:hypothetical protein
VNALEDFLAAYTRADQAGDPAYPGLARFSSGSALAWASKQVRDHVKLGVAHRGYADVRAIQYDVRASSARVRQCMDWSNWPVANRTTGAVFQRFSAWSQTVDARLELRDGQWRVVTIAVSAGPC